MLRITILACAVAAPTMTEPTHSFAEDRTLDQVRQMMKDAGAHGLVRRAKKTKPVDVRPARPGEVIVTVIAGEGKETQSRPAEKGDRRGLRLHVRDPRLTSASGRAWSI